MRFTPIWAYFVRRHLTYRKRRGISSWYSSHGMSYELLLLLYGFCLLTSDVLTVSAIPDGNGADDMNDGIAGGSNKSDVMIDAQPRTNSDSKNESRIFGGIAPMSLTVVQALLKTDIAVKIPDKTEHAADADDEFYDDDDDDEPLVVGAAGMCLCNIWF